MDQVGYDQSNLVEDIVIRLTAEFQHQKNMAKSVSPEDSEPPVPAPPTATGTAKICSNSSPRIKISCKSSSPTVVKAVEIITTDLLLPPPYLSKANLINQCLHISIDIDGIVKVETTRDSISTLNHLDTSKIPQWTTIWAVATMYALHDGVGPYQL